MQFHNSDCLLILLLLPLHVRKGLFAHDVQYLYHADGKEVDDSLANLQASPVILALSYLPILAASRSVRALTLLGLLCIV